MKTKELTVAMVNKMSLKQLKEKLNLDIPLTTKEEKQDILLKLQLVHARIDKQLEVTPSRSWED